LQLVAGGYKLQPIKLHDLTAKAGGRGIVVCIALYILHLFGTILGSWFLLSFALEMSDYKAASEKTRNQPEKAGCHEIGGFLL